MNITIEEGLCQASSLISALKASEQDKEKLYIAEEM